MPWGWCWCLENETFRPHGPKAKVTKTRLHVKEWRSSKPLLYQVMECGAGRLGSKMQTFCCYGTLCCGLGAKK